VTGRRTVVFDCAGVIVRWRPVQLIERCFPAHAFDDTSATRVADALFQHFEPGSDWGAFDCGQVEPAALAERIAARTGLPHAGIAALIGAIPEHLEPVPETLALIERLQAAGHRLALLSNMPRPYADHLEATHGCFAAFDHRVWSGRIGLMKPGRAIFDHLQHALALDLRDAIFLDDHAGNVAAARSYGWQALLFTGAAPCDADLRARGF
jgi:putative hydrolase of the HAD superfamily